MEHFFIYSLKSAIILSFFWVVYRVFLYRETFFRFNRFFLLSGMFAALVFPLIIIRYPVEIVASTLSVTHYDIVEIASTGTYIDIAPLSMLLTIVYLMVVFVLSVVQVAGVVRLFKKIRQSNIQQSGSYTLIESSGFSHAFSFFRYVCVPDNLSEEQKNIILRHESAHTGQHHWIDLFAVNVLNLIWWFNPVLWFYSKAIRNNHEYLADKEALNDCRPDIYQQTLLNQWFAVPLFPMSNAFAFTNNLNRIHMMNKKISNPMKKWTVLSAVPALCFFMWAFAEPVYHVMPVAMPQQQVDMSVAMPIASPQQQIDMPVQAPVPVISEAILSSEADPVPSLPEKTNATQSVEKEKVTLILQDTIRIRSINGNSSGTAPLIIVDGKEDDSMLNTLTPSEIESISVLKNESAIRMYGEAGKNGVIMITTKAAAKNTVINEEPNLTEFFEKQMLPAVKQANKPIYYVDGQIVPNLDHIKPADIESIEVRKNANDIHITDIERRNGAVYIWLKKRE